MTDIDIAVAAVEAALGMQLPADFRDFLLSPESEGAVERVSFLNQVDEGVWEKDFPFAPHPHSFDVEAAIEEAAESGDFDSGVEALYACLERDFSQPATYGSVVLGQDFSTEDCYRLILRGQARGQVWFQTVSLDRVLLCPTMDPVMNQPLGFSRWRELRMHPYRLTVQKPKKLKQLGCVCFRFPSPEAQEALLFHLAQGQLRGIEEHTLGGIRKLSDVPESAEFLDPYSNEWTPLSKATVVSWLGGIIPI